MGGQVSRASHGAWLALCGFTCSSGLIENLGVVDESKLAMGGYESVGTISAESDNYGSAMPPPQRRRTSSMNSDRQLRVRWRVHSLQLRQECFQGWCWLCPR